MARVVLISGGARSGKSGFAEALAARMGKRVVYVATHRHHGREAHQRIERHRARRPGDWTTVEEPLDLGVCASAGRDAEVVLVEDLHLWTANRLLALGDADADDWLDKVAELEKELVGETTRLVSSGRDGGYHLLLVTSEVGLGMVPDTRRQRAFRDLLGRVNESAAAGADEVFLVVAGQALPLRRLAMPSEDVPV